MVKLLQEQVYQVPASRFLDQHAVLVPAIHAITKEIMHKYMDQSSCFSSINVSIAIDYDQL